MYIGLGLSQETKISEYMYVGLGLSQETEISEYMYVGLGVSQETESPKGKAKLSKPLVSGLTFFL